MFNTSALAGKSTVHRSNLACAVMTPVGVLMEKPVEIKCVHAHTCIYMFLDVRTLCRKLVDFVDERTEVSGHCWL